MGVGDLYIFVTIDLYEEKNLTKVFLVFPNSHILQVLDCLMEIQKIYDQNNYKAAIKEAKEQGPAIVSEASGTQKEDISITNSITAMTPNPGDISTMNQDEELRKQLKYIPKLALACQNWIEGMI